MKVKNIHILESLEEFKVSKEYWLDKLTLPLANIRLPFEGNSGKSVDSHQTGEHKVTLYKGVSDHLLSIAKNRDISLYTILLSAFKVLLYKYSGQNDIIVGAPLINNNDKEMPEKKLILLRDILNSNDSFKAFLLSVSRTITEGYRNQHYPVDELLNALGINNGDIPGSNITFILENIHSKREFESSGNENLSFSFRRDNNKIELKMTYNAYVFSDDSISRFALDYIHILNQAISDLDKRIKDIELIAVEEKVRILDEFNSTATECPDKKCIHGLFEEQAQKSPERIAASFYNNDISYGALNERANQIAGMLKNSGLRKGDVIAVMIPRSIDMLAGLLGVLKIGGVCLPVDLNYPSERIMLILSESGAKAVLKRGSVNCLNNFLGKILDIEESEFDKFSKNNPGSKVRAEDLCYLIFTSGSTGKPKGVMLKHSGIVNHAYAKIKELGMDSSDVVSQNLNISFVASIWQLFSPLFIGAKVNIYSEGISNDPYELLRTVKNEGVSILEIVPAMLNSYLELLDAGMDSLNISGLKSLVLTGERVSPSLVNRFYRIYSVQLINAYGQSECSDDTLHYKIPKRYDTTSVPIGKPAINTRVYVINFDGNIQPIGIPGEICIAGKGLAEGYLNDTEMTSAKFINNPFTPGERMYKTGDFGRWLDDGNIEYLGRVDQQIKLRGYRIELAEIESRLQEMDCIRSAVVVLKEMGDSRYLCAYVVADKELHQHEIRDYLSARLPEYMVPAYIMQMEKFPLAPNGKVDRMHLPEPDMSSNNAMEGSLPESALEKELAKLWEEVLGVGSIKLNDDFFSLGGHSLKATLLVAKIHKSFDVKITIREIFEQRSLKRLAEHIQAGEKNTFSGVKHVAAQKYYPASSAQKRIYILEQIEAKNNAYHVPFIIRVDGKLNTELLKKSFDALILRHESLRTFFDVVDGELVQVVQEEAVIDVFSNGIGGITTLDEVKEFIRPFDLGKAPLLRAGVIRRSEDCFDILVDVHHAVVDGVSIGILMRDLTSLYRGEELPPLKLQYKDFSTWQKDFLKSDIVKKQVNYWKEFFSEGIPVLDLPTDYPRPTLKSYEGNTITVKLEREKCEKLKTYALNNESTLYMVMLAAFNVLLFKHTGQEDIVVGSPIAGREHADLDNIIGMFVNTIPMRNFPKGGITFRDFLFQVRENSIKAYEHQAVQFEELVQLLDVKRDLGRNPMFDVMFILQNTNIGKVKTEELTLSLRKFNHQVSRFDLTIEAIDTGDGMELYFEYCTGIFCQETIVRLAEHYINVLNSILMNDRVSLSKIDLLSDSEKEWIFANFNDTFKAFDYMPIHRIFEQMVESGHGTGKLIYGEKSLSYSELNRRSNQLAHLLRGEGIKGDEPVAIIMHRGIETIIGIMGIIKSGGAYVPIDPSYPQDRVEYMINHSETKIVVTEEKLLDKVYEIIKNNNRVQTIIDLVGEGTNTNPERRKIFNKQSLEAQDTCNPTWECNVQDLMYIIYTSGSTGLPKGVMVTHSNAVNYIKWAIDNFGLGYNDRMMLVTSISFDISVFEIFGALLSGADLVIMSENEMRDVNSLIDSMEKTGVNIWHSVPVLMTQAIISLKHRKDKLNILNNIRKILIGGEAWGLELASEISEMFVNADVINMYGPTEATIWVTSYKTDNKQENMVSLPIGKPISNNRLVIMDSGNKLCGVGIPGDIYISGANITRGYFKDAEKTREAFIPDDDTGEILYRTGDTGRYLRNGNVEFLGRKDGMVKVRGYRIEVGEIENVLLSSGKVDSVAVVAKKDSVSNRLICYYVSNEEQNQKELADCLMKKLPEYMIPSNFIKLEKMVVTPNGKIDRKKLSNMEVESCFESENKYIEPTTEIEKFLVDVWKKLLGNVQIGIHDNFFSIGGNSFLLTQMFVDIDAKYPGQLQIVDLFSYTTIERLAAFLADKGNSKGSNCSKEESMGFNELISGFENNDIDAELAAKLLSEMEV